MDDSRKDVAPPDVVADAEARRAARAGRDWPEADRLRGLIEAAGWKVVDSGTSFRLVPAHPPTISEGGRTKYGSSTDVPSRLDDAAVGSASIVTIAGEWKTDLIRFLGRLADHAPDGTQIIVVAEDQAPEQAALLAELDALDPGAPGVETEVVWLSAQLGRAAALNAGIRRAVAPVVVLVDASVDPTGDFISPLIRALDDRSIGVAGGFGLRSGDLRHFEDGAPGDVDAIDQAVQAFRRADYSARGPLDEKFTSPRYLDVWWSLVLRDEGEDRPARRAVAIDLPVVRGDRPAAETPGDERDRPARRNFYRLIDRFGPRRDLLIAPAPAVRHPPRDREAPPTV